VEKFGCIQSVECGLSPLHAFIGPNDSGKTTLLRALRLLATQACIASRGDPSKVLDPSDERISVESPTILKATLSGGAQYSVQMPSKLYPELHETLRVGEEFEQRKRALGHSAEALRMTGLVQKDRETLQAGASFLRIDPRVARKPSELISSGQPLRFFDENGAGLASVIQGINGRDVDAFVALRDEFCKLFPAVKRLKTLIDSEKRGSIEVDLIGGDSIPPSAMSEGMIYFLSFAALRYLNGQGLLLIEEPENGLHPARIAEVVKILRHVSQETQVIVATHSPLVINELRKEEVSVVTRNIHRGTQITPLKDTFNYDERSRFYSNGELWLLHSDGVEEHDLLQEPAPAYLGGDS
jgi:predicted ATPase